ncbi:putative hydrolase YugF [Lachnellula arida]|uniref:Putative hydrolase YugF n=1 Tax=Lachnellula arida TaxID=1316785 RepID=A0A8T9BMR2_9HELO|nr:putative hydrolase YugF [Lachnellula arida]
MDSLRGLGHAILRKVTAAAPSLSPISPPHVPVSQRLGERQIRDKIFVLIKHVFNSYIPTYPFIPLLKVAKSKSKSSLEPCFYGQVKMKTMDLPSTFHFQGWNIRYNLRSNNTTASNQPQLKPVVFVHGTPWSSAVFQPVIKALLAKPSYQILVYDLPGYGQSQEFAPSPPSSTIASSEEKPLFQGDTSVKFQAKALAGLLKHVQLDGKAEPEPEPGHPAPAVIAHDIAGTIVLRAHLLEACEFDTMMLVDANAVLPWGDGFYKLAREAPASFLRLPPGIFEAVVRAVIQSAVHDTNVLKTGWEDALARPWVGGEGEAGERQKSFVRQIAQADDGDVAEMLEGGLYGRVRCDVKIVWGEQDQWIPKHKVEDLIRRLGGKVKESAFIPEAGHLVMLDQPERFAIEVFDWLTRFGSPRSLSTS